MLSCTLYKRREGGLKDSMTFAYFKIAQIALASLAQWFERWPKDRRVPGSIPANGTYLGCGLDFDSLALVGACMGGNQPMCLSCINVSFSLSPFHYL